MGAPWTTWRSCCQTRPHLRHACATTCLCSRIACPHFWSPTTTQPLELPGSMSPFPWSLHTRRRRGDCPCGLSGSWIFVDTCNQYVCWSCCTVHLARRSVQAVNVQASADLACKFVRGGLSRHIQYRVEESKRNHWVWGWAAVNLSQVCAIMAVSGHLLQIDDMECARDKSSLLSIDSTSFLLAGGNVSNLCRTSTVPSACCLSACCSHIR